MKTIKAIAIVLLAFGGGLALWAIGSRIDTDAAAMGVGLIFGVLVGVMAGMPLGWMLAKGQQQSAGNEVSVIDVQRAEMERACARLVERQSYELQRAHVPAVIVGNPPADDDLDEYTPAYPFGRRQFRITGEVEP